jgi:serine/threonine protein kinase
LAEHLYLCQTSDRLLVVKEHIHNVGINAIAYHVLDEVMVYTCIRPRLHSSLTRHFPSLVDVCIDKNKTSLALEYVPLCFHDVFNTTSTISIHFILTRMLELTAAVAGLHAMSIAHRDIKEGNLRFRGDGSLVVIDFDSAGYTEEKTNSCNVFPVTTCTTRPPELLIYDDVNDLDRTDIEYNGHALDVWSTGCVLVQMANDGNAMFPGVDTQQVHAQSLATFVDDKYVIPSRARRRLGPELTQIINDHLLCQCPSDRATMQECHTLFTKHLHRLTPQQNVEIP